MEVLLAKVTQQAMSYAIRSGIAITSTYALKQCGRLMKTVEGREKEELATLQRRLDSKIKIISPAIDMIELIAARGNTSLESAVGLTKSLRWDIQTLGTRVEKAVSEEQLARRGSAKAKPREQNDIELKIIISEMRKLLERIEDAVPLINLAITTSGVSLSTTLPATVSPSRLLQASTFLTDGDSNYYSSKPRAQQIGPTFTLSMYMLFAGHANRPQDEGVRETTWKEVMHKARVTLMRVPLDNVYDYPIPFGQNTRRAKDIIHRQIPSDSTLQEFAYQLLIVEDLDDGRMHNFEDDEPHPEAYAGIEQAGVREIIPIHEVSKIFYADTGKILNIGTEGEINNPILLLKRDINSAPPRRMMDQNSAETGYESDDSHTVAADEADPAQAQVDAQFRRESTPNLEETAPQERELPVFPWRLPPTLDLEWVALEVYTEDPSTDSDTDEPDDIGESDIASLASPLAADPDRRSRSESPALLSRLSNLNIRTSTPSESPVATQNNQVILSPQKASVPVAPHASQAPTTLPPIKSTLSLLEMMIRLTALQQFQQSSHLAIPDEFLNFFLSDSSTVGAGSDADMRRRVRHEALKRVGFDPYNESPIKRRGETYLEHELHDTEDGFETTSPSLDGSAYDYEGYPASRGISSPSPLLRRATTQPGQASILKQPRFRGPPTRQSFRGGSVALDTPPSSVGRQV